ncbi:MAG: UDP-N-acetylglucosamine 1-carboxyvinyltransferase [Clostridiales bacterium]|nr:UDP-N-acetylglucosamine 1-carboxyvinyltransferase [Clostridiales bacterium]
MDYIIDGGKRLGGEISVYGAKNCALALLGATVLTNDTVVLQNCPQIEDVNNMLRLLKAMGKKVQRKSDTVQIFGGLCTTSAPWQYATLIRGSALILGSTLARYHSIDLPLPGGCAIGARPMDIHLLGLEAMGVTVEETPDSLHCFGIPKGTNYNLRFASVGATENLLCASVLAKGESVFTNCATEPEVVALEQMLVAMGADIQGIGTTTLVINGVDRLHGAVFNVIPDRIVAATYLAATVATCGDVTITNCRPAHLTAFIDLLRPHFAIIEYEDAIRLTVEKQPSSYGNVTTAPYPLFPTDMQSLLMSLAAFSNGGQTTICEKLFENRLQHNAQELAKMGAHIDVKDDFAKVYGRGLHGATVQAHDLRGGAGLVVAALNAEGRSRVRDVEHVNRGYSNLAQNLVSIGAKITVID